MFGLDKTASRIVTAMITLALLCLVGFTFGYCAQSARLKAAKGDAAMSQGRTVSAGEAIKEIGDLGDRGQVIDAEVKGAQDAIRQAPAADRDRVARYQLCLVQHRTNCDGLLDPS